MAFGTKQDISAIGYGIMGHSMAPKPVLEGEPYQRLIDILPGEKAAEEIAEARGVP